MISKFFFFMREKVGSVILNGPLAPESAARYGNRALPCLMIRNPFMVALEWPEL